MRATGSATSNDWLARMSSDNWPWFRLYIDWISHPKVQRLSEADQRRFVCLMCMQSAGRLKRSSIGDIAFELRISEDEAEATVSRLKSAKLLDRDGGVHNWDQRQPKRDHSAKRTAKYRQRKALRDSGVESPAGHGDADVTRCDGHGDALDQRIEEQITSDTSAKAAEEVALDPRAEKVTHLLRGLILENDPRARVPSPDTGQWRTWVRHTHMIHRIDGRDWQEIDRVVRWCQADPFWKSNILSPAKLRKQFTTLMLKSQGGRRMEGFNERYA